MSRRLTDIAYYLALGVVAGAIASGAGVAWALLYMWIGGAP